ncbi:YbfB/YjiJ family MFS transporter [Siccirubricoccus sp. KC 17139]|uniref:YbfB/YjiJ family MFS transporter n=1 Tax=Siccirubricoccus soli TaxID=2899147 RepID=A0ABT1D222_9PROT|nr:YbfB/YjiJ family MFS transporter [Siccirubricoccus soli]MCO6415080.1 YbfB/YjiJ family MFS transporter [Siccirubricoccus soli]MCP2681211.1 YbfB/YjiJ family MFS transporter [Siccirubricoccus soli]
MSPAMDTHHPSAYRLTTARLIGSGILALAVAMGVGRFAFTPLLPLMLRDGTLDAATGAEWAATNYTGYLLGALTAPWFGGDPRRGLRLALAGVALTTLAVAGLDGPMAAPLGAALRAAAGVCSAWALVCASAWCLAELARHQAARLGAWVYTGVGLGIALAGGLAWLGGQQPARWLWLELGLAAAFGAVLVGLAAPRGAAAPVPRPLSAPAAGPRRHSPMFVLSYGIFGFGYIVPATFLPAMARQQVPDPLVFGLTWPLFGLAAAVSVGAAARWLPAWPRRRVWALAHGAMALGTAITLVSQSLWALAAAAVLVGGTFMVATMAGLQLAREQFPANPTPLLARMTVAFAAGQIAGPVLVRAIGSAGWAGLDALAWANALATLLLMLTAAWLWRGGEVPGHAKGR